ncbi:AMP-binding protein, partial [Micrococcus sp. GbtcB5]|uniref:AMP-binding protein n=1 Tax=Micrococcus sp. GbtcB5 TaxID=2824750 RepID=UPI001C302F98
DFLDRQATERPDPGLFAMPDAQHQWPVVSARVARDRVRALAKGLIAAGIQPGATVGLLASTRLEWPLVDFAIWYAGAVP